MEENSESSDQLLAEMGFQRPCFKADEDRLRSIKRCIATTGANKNIKLEEGCDRLAAYIDEIDKDESITQVNRFGPLQWPKSVIQVAGAVPRVAPRACLLH